MSARTNFDAVSSCSGPGFGIACSANRILLRSANVAGGDETDVTEIKIISTRTYFPGQMVTSESRSVKEAR